MRRVLLRSMLSRVFNDRLMGLDIVRGARLAKGILTVSGSIYNDDQRLSSYQRMLKASYAMTICLHRPHSYLLWPHIHDVEFEMSLFVWWDRLNART